MYNMHRPFALLAALFPLTLDAGGSIWTEQDGRACIEQPRRLVSLERKCNSSRTKYYEDQTREFLIPW